MIRRWLRNPRIVWGGTALLVLSAFLALFGRVLLRDETFIDRDLHAFFRPGRALLVRLVHEAHGLPLWNPYLAMGQPFAANPNSELFHPLSLLFFVLPFEWAFRLQVLLPVIVSGAGMAFLLRTLRRSPAATLFGALAWAGGGYIVSTTNVLNVLYAVSVLPAALAFVVRLARGGRRRDAVALAALVGLLALPCEVPTVYAFALLAVAAAAEGVRRGGPPREAGRRLLLTGGALALGALLAAATLLPGLFHAKKTIRAHGLDAALASAWSTPPLRLLELAQPYALGHIERTSDRWFWGAPLYGAVGYPYLFTIYAGLLALLLAPLAWTGRRRLSPAWGLAGLVGLFLALGSHTPVYEAARRAVPFFSSFRIPERFLAVPLLVLCVAAATGFDALLLGRRRTARFLAGGAALLGCAGLALALLVWWAPLGEAGELWTRLGASPLIAPELGRTLVRDGLRLAVTGGAFALLFALFDRLGRRAAAALLLALGCGELLEVTARTVRTVPARLAAAMPPHLAQAVKRGVQGPLVFLETRILPHYLWAGPPIPATWGLSTGLDADVDLTQLRWSMEAVTLFLRAIGRDPAMTAPILRRLGAEALVTAAPAGAPNPVQIAFLARPRPFAFAVTRIEPLASEEAWVEAALRLREELASTACVLVSEAGELPARPAPAEVKVVARRPGRVSLSVAAAGPESSFLAINQSWDPGWRATVDGDPARLLRVDVQLSGMRVPPGEHRVELVYRDRSVYAGLAISLAAVLGLVWLAVRRPAAAAPPPP